MTNLGIADAYGLEEDISHRGFRSQGHDVSKGLYGLFIR